MTIHSERTVSDLAVAYPVATRVFARHQIDFCCGGGTSLADACRMRGLDADTIVSEIHTELQGLSSPETCWEEEPLSDLIEHILHAYHRPLDEELPRLEALATKVARVHGDTHDSLATILSVFVGLKVELEEHMAKEEQILFPMILGGHGMMADGPIAVMRDEHDEVGAVLTRLRALTHDYDLPPQACNSWRALWHGLAALEESLHQHIHLENNVLFPRALEG